ncbi:MAG: hypothetical protein GY818_18095, partial [Planctomycetaceae bacterium]|nr:hypothetical protein [Planctomycetaceae bacterium]
METDTTLNHHVLLTSLGLGGSPKDRLESKYHLEGKDKSFSAKSSVIALLKLLPDDSAPTKVICLLTPKAAKPENTDLQALESDAEKFKVPLERVEIPDSLDDAAEYLQTVANNLEGVKQITLDVTLGIRHHAFLFYALALFLEQFLRVDVKGAYYCFFEKKEGKFFDLKPSLDMAKWVHAIAVWKETGSLKQVSDLVVRQGQELKDMSVYLSTGLPIETGMNAGALTGQIKKGERLVEKSVPLSKKLETELEKEIRGLSAGEFRKKEDLVLDETELDRQAEIIDLYFKTNQLNLAFGLLREWTVNFLLFHRKEQTSWLGRDRRSHVERMLGGIVKINRPTRGDVFELVKKGLTKEQEEWAKRWDGICQLRNQLQHHGMKAELFKPDGKQVKNRKEDWDAREKW